MLGEQARPDRNRDTNRAAVGVPWRQRHPEVEVKWPLRYRSILIVGSNAILWALIIAAVVEVLG